MDVQKGSEDGLEEDFEDFDVENSLISHLKDAGRGPSIHIRVQQQRRGKITIVEGLSLDEIEKILRPLKKGFCCGGSVVKDDVLGSILRLSGDHRSRLRDELISRLGKRGNEIKIHGD